MNLKKNGVDFYINAYVFEDLHEGKKIAEEVFGLKDFEKMVRPENFKLLERIPPDSKIHGHNYAIIKNDAEFWILKNYEEAYLYGSGFFLYGTYGIPK